MFSLLDRYLRKLVIITLIEYLIYDIISLSFLEDIKLFNPLKLEI